MAIRTSGATANLGVGMLFQTFAAVVIGGVSLKGGVGSLTGVYAGVLLLSSIQTAINLMGMPAHFTQLIQGGMVLVAVLLALGRLASDLELVAMRAGGVSLAKLYPPVLGLGLVFSLGMLALRGRQVVPAGWQAWKMGTIGAAASFGAYAIAVWAMTIAPIALVAALRETSILFAVLIGWLGFGERMTPEKALAALTIVAGVMLTRI